MTNANNNMSVVALERRSLPKNAIVQNQKVFCYFRLCVFLLSPPPPAGHAAHSKENKTSRVKVWTTCDVIFIFAYVASKGMQSNQKCNRAGGTYPLRGTLYEVPGNWYLQYKLLFWDST
jgi:hypothetical protein